MRYGDKFTLTLLLIILNIVLLYIKYNIFSVLGLVSGVLTVGCLIAIHILDYYIKKNNP